MALAPETIDQARQLLRGARGATLATQTDGQPFASLVTPATAPDLSVLLLLSDLSEHTRQLRTDPRCAVMVVGEPDGLNVQTAPRLTVTGLAHIEPDPALKQRWIAHHPYAAFYAGFGDFNLWRVALDGGHLIGGFARAYRLRQAELAPDPAGVAAIAAAEADILVHCNNDHAEALDVIAGAHGGDGTGWALATVDVDGGDLVQGERVITVAWPEQVADPDGIRRGLILLARAARERLINTTLDQERPVA